MAAPPPPIVHVPDINEACATFEHHLDEFRKDTESGAQFFYAMMAIHGMARENEDIYRTIDSRAMFWNTNVAALQMAFFVILGRIFDQKSHYNIDRLLSFARLNQAVFSIEALADRKRRGSSNADEWLPNYLKGSYKPNDKDFKCLKLYVKKYRGIYEKNYLIIRNKIYAHKELALKSDKDSAFANTRIMELEKIFSFLTHSHEILWQLYHNGEKPRFRRIASSSTRMMRKAVSSYQTQTVQQRITTETKEFLRDISSVRSSE